MPIAAVSNLEDLLGSLKTYLKNELAGNSRIIKTVKVGLIDERDELPMLGVLPIIETVSRSYNDGLLAIDRDFRLDIIDKAYTVDEVRESLRKKISQVTALFSPEHLKWNLINGAGEIQVYDFDIKPGIFGEPAYVENYHTQYATVNLTLRSYLQLIDTIVANELEEISYLELLDYLYDNAKNEFTQILTFWKDSSKPISLENFPALGIFLQEPGEDKDSQSSTNFKDLTIIYRVYSSLATREIAFINHLRNVETIKRWIHRRPDLGGKAESFKITSIDYGIDNINRPFQGGVEEVPVFRSDITVMASLIDFKHG